MATKTITVTEDAYTALHNLKEPAESFSETILRISNKRSLRDFVGVLSDESAEKIEKTIKEIRKRHTKAHWKRVNKIREALEYGHS